MILREGDHVKEKFAPYRRGVVTRVDKVSGTVDFEPDDESWSVEGMPEEQYTYLSAKNPKVSGEYRDKSGRPVMWHKDLTVPKRVKKFFVMPDPGTKFETSVVDMHTGEHRWVDTMGVGFQPRENPPVPWDRRRELRKLWLKQAAKEAREKGIVIKPYRSGPEHPRRIPGRGFVRERVMRGYEVYDATGKYLFKDYRVRRILIELGRRGLVTPFEPEKMGNPPVKTKWAPWMEVLPDTKTVNEGWLTPKGEFLSLHNLAVLTHEEAAEDLCLKRRWYEKAKKLAEESSGFRPFGLFLKQKGYIRIAAGHSQYHEAPLVFDWAGGPIPNDTQFAVLESIVMHFDGEVDVEPTLAGRSASNLKSFEAQHFRDEGMTLRSYLGNPSEYAKERAEHPTLPAKAIRQIVKDHQRAEAEHGRHNPGRNALNFFWATENTKLEKTLTIAFNQMPLSTCPAAGICKAFCFGQRGFFKMTDHELRLAYNTLARLDPRVSGVILAPLRAVLEKGFDPKSMSHKVAAHKAIQAALNGFLYKGKTVRVGAVKLDPKFSDKVIMDLEAILVTGAGPGMRKPRSIRINDVGDFDSQDYVDAWVKVARHFAGRLHFYAYTKSHHRYDFSKFPKGFVLVKSFGGVDDRYIDTAKDYHALVFFGKKTHGFVGMKPVEARAEALKSAKVAMDELNAKRRKKGLPEYAYGSDEDLPSWPGLGKPCPKHIGLMPMTVNTAKAVACAASTPEGKEFWMKRATTNPPSRGEMRKRMDKRFDDLYWSWALDQRAEHGDRFATAYEMEKFKDDIGGYISGMVSEKELEKWAKRKGLWYGIRRLETPRWEMKYKNPPGRSTCDFCGESCSAGSWTKEGKPVCPRCTAELAKDSMASITLFQTKALGLRALLVDMEKELARLEAHPTLSMSYLRDRLSDKVVALRRALGIANPPSCEMWEVVDSPFNRAHYASIVGKRYPIKHPPSYAEVRRVREGFERVGPPIGRRNPPEDPTEGIRRDMVESHVPGERADLEARFGQVWDTDQVRAEFKVIGFMAPFVVVERLADGVKGSLMFQHSPRYYFSFTADNPTVQYDKGGKRVTRRGVDDVTLIATPGKDMRLLYQRKGEPSMALREVTSMFVDDVEENPCGHRHNPPAFKSGDRVVFDPTMDAGEKYTGSALGMHGVVVGYNSYSHFLVDVRWLETGKTVTVHEQDIRLQGTPRRNPCHGFHRNWGECPVCGGPGYGPGEICMDCVRARHRAAVTHRCSCGKKRQPKVVDLGFRRYTACERCLGVISQENPKVIKCPVCGGPSHVLVRRKDGRGWNFVKGRCQYSGDIRTGKGFYCKTRQNPLTDREALALLTVAEKHELDAARMKPGSKMRLLEAGMAVGTGAAVQAFAVSPTLQRRGVTVARRAASTSSVFKSRLGKKGVKKNPLTRRELVALRAVRPGQRKGPLPRRIGLDRSGSLPPSLDNSADSTLIGRKCLTIETTTGKCQGNMGAVVGLDGGAVLVKGLFTKLPSGRVKAVWYADEAKAKREGMSNPGTPWKHDFSSEDVSISRCRGGILLRGKRPLWGMR